MFDSDSDDEVPLKRVSSVSGKTKYEQVPFDIDFKLKQKKTGEKSEKLLYTLKEGVNLPYTPEIKGRRSKLSFSIFMYSI